MSFDNTQDYLISLLSNALFQKPLISSENINFEALYEESAYQAVPMLAFSALNKDNVPKEIYERWEFIFNMDLLRNSKVSYGHTLVHEMLTASGIPYVILKGCVSSSYYPASLVRKLGDVDFLVKPQDFERAKSLFLENGFEYVETNHEYEIELVKDGVIYELHRRVNGVPDNELGVRIDKLLEDIFDKAQFVETDFASYMSPSVFHHGLVMLLHVARHMITGGVGLRHLCDWIVFVDSLGDSFAVIFEEKLKDIGLWHFAQILTSIGVRYLGCPNQSFLTDVDDELLESLKNDILAGGNFGKKDLKRSDEAKFITTRKDGRVSNKSSFMQAVSSANEIVKRHWKWADRVPVFYPFGWVYYGSKYGIKALLGKRDKKNISALIEGAEKRKEIYKELNLFE